MTDKYQCYDALAAEKTEGIDFSVTVEAAGRNRNIAICAPHGGKIERHTSEIARDIAGDDFCLYLFEGLMGKNNFAELHITSSNFDERRAIKLVTECSTVIAIHGREDRGDLETIFIGGLHDGLIDLIKTHLEKAEFKTKSEDHDFPGKCKRNICNRGTCGQGVQLEIPVTLRTVLHANVDKRKRLAHAVRQAMNTVYPIDKK
jgi:phage replication-related protein YjqB (UPF0714/DUF867 family)